jgi:cell filamentation protein
VSDPPPGHGRSARDRRAHNKHFYPNSDVLRNLPGLLTADELERFERVAVANASLRRAPLTEFTSVKFKAIHALLFAEVYSWAGQVRDYSTGRGAAPFCLPEFIDVNLDKIFVELRAADGLCNLSKPNFAERVAAVINEINAVHPFIEGNGRVCREFLKDLAARAGHPIDLTRLTRESWYAAAARGFAAADNAPMCACLLAAL